MLSDLPVDGFFFFYLGADFALVANDARDGGATAVNDNNMKALGARVLYHDIRVHYVRHAIPPRTSHTFPRGIDDFYSRAPVIHRSPSPTWPLAFPRFAGVATGAVYFDRPSFWPKLTCRPAVVYLLTRDFIQCGKKKNHIRSASRVQVFPSRLCTPVGRARDEKNIFTSDEINETGPTSRPRTYLRTQDNSKNVVYPAIYVYLPNLGNTFRLITCLLTTDER